MITIINKAKISKVMAALAFMAATLLPTACDDLLDQQATTALPADKFWKTEGDATIALNGAYAAVRQCFDRDYYFDGQGEFVMVNGSSTGDTNPYNGGNYTPLGQNYGSAFDRYFRYLYGAVVRTNYVVENVTKMVETAPASSKANLERIIGEARLLRGIVYFRLISMWGDVPYFENVPASIVDNEEIFFKMPRTSIATVKDKILADLTYAFEKVEAKRSVAGPGRGTKPAALAFRGKVQLFWASWHKYGWPELSTFVADPGEATAAYTAAAADFKKVIDDYGLTLFRNGEPGQIDALGKAEILPNYFYLFQPAASNDVTNTEMIMSFNHGSTGSGQGEELMREFGTRTQQTAQGFVKPRFMIADRYQLITTGEFAPPLVPDGGALPPSTPTNTLPPRTTANSAVNPQSYADRDYRMKSTILWNYEMMMGMASLKPTGFAPFIYPNPGQQNVFIDGAGPYTTVNADNNNTGYIFRKFVRNYAGQDRSDGDYSFPIMRLADVYLMYAEASNEVNGPQPDAIDLVNKVRHRGNLPPLDVAHTGSADAFFAAIEQERIVELIGEGQRSFDLRRWRAIQRVWDPTGTNQGTQTKDTRNNNRDVFYRNASQLDYQKAYIFRIPPGERDQNPNLTQNIPWL
jgi:hypothetical protein